MEMVVLPLGVHSTWVRYRLELKPYLVLGSFQKQFAFVPYITMVLIVLEIYIPRNTEDAMVLVTSALFE
jgi:hypothetical protein